MPGSRHKELLFHDTTPMALNNLAEQSWLSQNPKATHPILDYPGGIGQAVLATAAATDRSAVSSVPTENESSSSSTAPLVPGLRPPPLETPDSPRLPGQPQRQQSRLPPLTDSETGTKVGGTVRKTPSSATRHAKSRPSPSPYAIDFGSIDLDDFNLAVDFTTDENTLSSESSGRPPRDYICLWREDYASRAEPLSRKGRKRKSGEISSRQTPAEEREEKKNSGDGLADFPDINELMGLSSPITRSPKKKSEQRPGHQHQRETPSKKPKRQPQWSTTPDAVPDAIMDLEDEFVTPPTRNAPLPPLLDDGPTPPPARHCNVAEIPLPKPVDCITSKPSHTASKPTGTHPLTGMDSGGPAQTSVGISRTPHATSGAEDAVPLEDCEDSGNATQPEVLSYWPALRWKQHCLDEKIKSNAAEYTKALRDKWPPARRTQVKREKEPLLAEKQTLDRLVEQFETYAKVYDDQEALLSATTEAYQNHQDTQAEESRLDVFAQELQMHEDALRTHLAEAGIDPTSYPADFHVESPHDNAAIPATQHPGGFVLPMTRMANPQTTSCQKRVSPHPLPPGPTHDYFGDFSDEIDTLQAAEEFEQQCSSGGDASFHAGTSRGILCPTSGNTTVPPRPMKAIGATALEAVRKASIPPGQMRFEWSEDVRRALKDHFLMSGFRHNQLKAINTTLAGKDAFVLMPTASHPLCRPETYIGQVHLIVAALRHLHDVRQASGRPHILFATALRVRGAYSSASLGASVK